MKIITRSVYQMLPNGGFELLEQDTHEHSGPVAQCFGGRSRTSATTSQQTTSTSVGFQDIEGLAIGGGGDVEVDIQTSDFGAIAAAEGIAGQSFDFAGEFGAESLAFAGDIFGQSAQIAERAIATSQQAIATVATDGQSDITAQYSGVIKFALGAAVFGLLFYFIARS